MASTTTATKPKPSPPDDCDVIVELLPPPDSGFSGTQKFYRQGNEAMIAELLKRGYAMVAR